MLLLTAASLLLAWATLRYRSASRAITLRGRLVAAVIDARLAEVDYLPIYSYGAGGRFARPREKIDEFFRVGGGWSSGAVWSLFVGGESSGTSTLSASYHFTEFAADGRPAKVRDALLKHYADALEPLGLGEPSTRFITGTESASGRYVWSTGDNDLVLVLDIRASDPALTADVEILLVESQDLGWW